MSPINYQLRYLINHPNWCRILTTTSMKSIEDIILLATFNCCCQSPLDWADCRWRCFERPNCALNSCQGATYNYLEFIYIYIYYIIWYIFRWYSAHEPSWCSLSLVDSMRGPTCQNELRIAGISGAGIYTCNQLHIHLYQRIYNTCFEHLHPKLMLSCFPSLSKKNTIWAPFANWGLDIEAWDFWKSMLESSCSCQGCQGSDPEHCGFVDFLVESCPKGLMWTERNGRKSMGIIY